MTWRLRPEEREGPREGDHIWSHRLPNRQDEPAATAQTRLGQSRPESSAANHAAAVALQHTHYNFAGTHRSLANPYPRTPAMAAGITDHVWTCDEIGALIEG